MTLPLPADVLSLITPASLSDDSADTRYSVGGHDVIVRRGVARPLTSEGDAFFGLEMGTNGTAAESRRACVLGAFEWRRSNFRPATGLTLNPPSISCSSEAPKGPWGNW